MSAAPPVSLYCTFSLDSYLRRLGSYKLKFILGRVAQDKYICRGVYTQTQDSGDCARRRQTNEQVSSIPPKQSSENSQCLTEKKNGTHYLVASQDRCSTFTETPAIAVHCPHEGY